MNGKIDVQKIERVVGEAVRYSYALHGLLDALVEDHFLTELHGARKEAGVPNEEKGSFWWMQNHYCSAKACADAAVCLAAMLERVLVDLDDTLPAGVHSADALPDGATTHGVNVGEPVRH